MRGRAWAALALAAAVGWSAWPLPRALATHVVDPVRLSPAGLWGRVDLDLLLWILAWDAHALATAPAALFQGNILYPAPDALASSEHLLGLAPVAAPVFLASGNAVLTYNVTVLITVLVTAVVTFALVRHWTGDGPAAFLAAAAFTFSPMNIHGWARLHATAVHLFPLVLLLAWRAAGAPRPRTLALLALAVALQCLAGMYVSYELLALVAAMAPALWWEALRHRRSGLAVAAALAAGALVLVPVGIPYLRARSAGILPEYGAVLAEGLAPTLARLGDALTWPVVALGLLGALGARRVPWHLRAGLCLVAVVGFALALGPAAPLVPGTDLPGLYALAARVVPGFAGMRAPIRFLVLPLLSLAVLAGMGAAAITGGRRWARVLPLAAAALVIHADARPVPLAPVLLEGSDVAAYRWLAEHGEHGPTLELPVFLSAMDGEQLLATGRYMVASTLHWNPLLNGYTGYTPPSYPLLATLAQRLPDPTALADLCALVALSWLVVHQAGLLPAERAAWEGGGAGLARAATFGDEVIYRIDRRCGGLEPALRRELVEPDPGPDGSTLRGVSRAPLADFRGELRARLPDAVVSGLHGWFAVTVSNTGSAPWPGLTARARGRVVLQARWRDAAGAVALAGEPGLLARDLAPGESVEARVGSMTPRPGSYTLEIGLLQDGVGWFAEQPGGTGLVTATVRARPWEEVYPPKR